ncbi:MAG: hypothetical protein SFT90_04235 [Rickettsiales bacterium]|nr:hypothetical protein [Rickettsiales bacterium]
MPISNGVNMSLRNSNNRVLSSYKLADMPVATNSDDAQNQLPQGARTQNVAKNSIDLTALQNQVRELTEIVSNLVSSLSKLKDLGLSSTFVDNLISRVISSIRDRIDAIVDRISDAVDSNQGDSVGGNTNSTGSNDDASDDVSSPITTPPTTPPVLPPADLQPPVDSVANPPAPPAPPVTPIAPPVDLVSNPPAPPAPPVTPPAQQANPDSGMGLLNGLLNNSNSSNSNSSNGSSSSGNSSSGNNSSNSNGNSSSNESNSNQNSSPNNNHKVDPSLLSKYLQNEDYDYSMYGNKVTKNVEDILKDLKIDAFYKISDHGATGEDLINDPGGYKYWNPHEEISNMHLVIKIPKLSAGEKVKLVDYQGFNAPSGIPQNFKYEVIEYKGSHFLMIPNEPGGFSDMLGSAASAFLKFASTSGKTFGVEVVGIAALCENSTFRTPDFTTIKSDGGIKDVFLTSNDAIHESVLEDGGSLISKIINVKLYNLTGQFVKDYSANSNLPSFLKISADKKSLEVNTANPELKALVDANGGIDIKFNQSCNLFSHDTRTGGVVRVIKAENYDQMFKSIQKGDSSEFVDTQASVSADILSFDDVETSSELNEVVFSPEVVDLSESQESMQVEEVYNQQTFDDCTNCFETYQLHNFGDNYS